MRGRRRCKRAGARYASNSQYFQVLTDSMLRTAPGMREILVERYAMGDGFYDGCGAMDYITEWFNTIHRCNPVPRARLL